MSSLHLDTSGRGYHTILGDSEARESRKSAKSSSLLHSPVTRNNPRGAVSPKGRHPSRSDGENARGSTAAAMDNSLPNSGYNDQDWAKKDNPSLIRRLGDRASSDSVGRTGEKGRGSVRGSPVSKRERMTSLEKRLS